ncbi:uncharacterized protein LOC123316632 [Coccinella septempunctata]|uniref:uncharacterized protein LOC123316632 n=1 Tax=Coccinella septempunctata TaxID=41139 RepID=UPI001D08AF1D|nr:uncharacterized protein LOC123316632 [Coccinella septempunctata]
MDDRKLIELVKKERFLYDSSDPYYNDYTLKMAKWKEISHVVRRDPNRCKSRWESLRNQFRKYIRANAGVSSGTMAKWRYYDNLSFLIPYMRNARPRYPLVPKEQEDSLFSAEASGGVEKSEEESEAETSNLTYDFILKQEEQEIDESANSDLMRDILDERKRKERQGEDSIDLFFDAMRATVKKFSEKNRILAKRRVFDVVLELEEAELNETQPCDAEIPHNSIDGTVEEDPTEIKPVYHIFSPKFSTPPTTNL